MSGLGLTYTTIASIIKYPCEASATDRTFSHRKKYGFFQSEVETVADIATELGMQREREQAVVYTRHPFVYLVEAADDICYSIMDMEDAHRLGILSHDVVAGSFLHVIASLSDTAEEGNKIAAICKRINDLNEKISYLRAKAIDVLTTRAAAVFWNNRQLILDGSFNYTLLDNIENSFNALSEVKDISYKKIYNHDTVLEVEIAGYNVMSALLQLFVPALLKQQKNHKDEKILKLIPLQFTQFEVDTSAYQKVMSAFDFISGMTDLYATEMYRKLTGIDIPQHR